MKRREEMICQFVVEFKCSFQVARAYLESEEWLYTEAAYSYNADRKAGLI